MQTVLQRAANVWEALAAPALRVWKLVPLHVQGKLLVILPIAAIVVSSGLALVGNYQRARIEAAMQRHIYLSRGFDNALTLMVNAETGMRGYLLTHRDEYLEPYALATDDLPSTLTDLRELAESEPGDQPRSRKLAAVESLTALIDRQMADLAWQRQYATGSDPSGDEISQHLALGKLLMDEIRTTIGTMQTAEEGLLLERMQEINDIRARDYLAVFLTVAVGLGARLVAWYLFSFGVIRRIEHLTANTRAVQCGESPPFPPSGKLDAIGELEDEIARLAGRSSPAPM